MKLQRFIILSYMICLVLFGILLVPFRLVWGPQHEIAGYVFAPLWSTISNDRIINGYEVFYELSVGRLNTTLFVLSLFFFSLYKFFSYQDTNRTKL